MIRPLLMSALIGLALTPAATQAEQLSRATQYLLGREAEKGCLDGGTFTSGYAETDLTGDGIRDLIVSHEGLACQGARGRSLLCGHRDCIILFFVGLENGLLVQVNQVFGRDMMVLTSDRPTVSLISRTGARQRLHWHGTAFKETAQ